MEEKKKIEMNIADTMMEKPIGFEINGRHFCLYTATLGKMHLISRLIECLDMNLTVLEVNPYIESLRLCSEKKDIVCRILAYYTMSRRYDIQNEIKVKKRTDFFNNNLDYKELAEILMIVLTWEDVQSYIKFLGLDKEQAVRKKITDYKQKKSSTLDFGGKSTYGILIDWACQRYGWTFDYVVWGISYANLQMLMADAIISIHLSDEEKKDLRIYDSDIIDANDPKNREIIRAMLKQQS